MKTTELIGPALDWAVAKCEGMSNLRPNPHRFDTRLIMDGPEGNGRFIESLNYSTNWEQGGPIIARERIGVWWADEVIDGETGEVEREAGWYSEDEVGCVYEGPTPLIAAMRCYVASRLGDEVEVPAELS